jgi:hypothetical protein
VLVERAGRGGALLVPADLDVPLLAADLARHGAVQPVAQDVPCETLVHQEFLDNIAWRQVGLVPRADGRDRGRVLVIEVMYTAEQTFLKAVRR